MAPSRRSSSAAAGSSSTPAAALYTPRMLEVLSADFRRLPELLAREPAPVAPPPPLRPLEPMVAEPAVQLGLF